MLPKVIMHNTVSLDGSITGFDVNIGLHYQIAGSYKADIVLVGSTTAKTGIEMFTEKVPVEDDSDFKKPQLSPEDIRPYWAIVDSKGTLKNLLHVYRRSEYCKDVIVFVSKKTRDSYLKYLKQRNYSHFIVGEDHVDCRKLLEILVEKYNAKIVLTDTGGRLNSILLEQGLMDEISLLISPVLVSKDNEKLF